jgi:hypothetical protein
VSSIQGKLWRNTYGEIADEGFLAKNSCIMPSYNLFLYNQHSRVRYPETLDVPDVDAAQRVARRVADVFMEVVPYWDELTPEQQHRYVVEIVDKAGGLLLTVPFREIKEPEPALSETAITGETEAPPGLLN